MVDVVQKPVPRYEYTTCRRMYTGGCNAKLRFRTDEVHERRELMEFGGMQWRSYIRCPNCYREVDVYFVGMRK